MTDTVHQTATIADIKVLEHQLVQLIIARAVSEGGTAREECNAKIREIETTLREMGSGDVRTVFGIAKLFELSDLERELLLLAFAPELDPQFRMGFSNLSPLLAPDGRPTIGLLTLLTDCGVSSSLDKRAKLARSGKLRRYRLIETYGNNGWAEADSFVLVTPAIRELLLGERFLGRVSTRKGVPSEASDMVSMQLSLRPDEGDRVLFIGEQPADRRGAAAAVAARAGFNVAFFELSPGETRADEIRQATDCIRDAILSGVLPVLELDKLDSRFQPDLLGALLGGDLTPRGSVLFSMAHDTSGTLTQLANNTVRHFVKPLGFEQSRRRWEEGANRNGVPLTEDDVTLLGNSFRMEPWVIDAAFSRARERAQDGEISVPMLAEQARQTAGAVSVSHARKVTPKQTLSQMVLPKSVMEHLALLIGFAGKREQLLHEYGYAERFTMGRGLVALLSGESGTGKTMAAEVLAHALEKDLYIVDLSRLVSKWVGETEKNIDKIFSEADQTQGVLLFDEADSLFANRSGEVNSSNDRYANMEVGYLLQRIESYRGIAVLTTNLSQNIDDAFLRRFHFRIDFPKPSADLREKLWRKMLDGTGYSEADLDLKVVSGRYELTGGNIRNALMKATYLADRDKKPISQAHIEEAALLESMELGRLV